MNEDLKAYLMSGQNVHEHRRGKIRIILWWENYMFTVLVFDAETKKGIDRASFEDFDAALADFDNRVKALEAESPEEN